MIYIKSLFLLFLFLNGCNKKQEIKPLTSFDNLKNPEMTLKVGLDSLLVGEVLSMDVNVDNLFLLTKKPERIYKYNLDSFSLDTIYNQVGKGPGELSDPKLIAASDNNIFVVDVSKMSIDIFSTSLDFIQTIPLNGIPNSIDVIDREYLAVSFIEIGQSRIELYDTQLIKTLIIKAASNKPIETIGKLKFIDEESIYFSRRYINESFRIEIVSGITSKNTNPYLLDKSTTYYFMGEEIPEFNLVGDLAANRTKIFTLAGISSKDGQPLFVQNKDLEIKAIYILGPPLSLIAANEDAIYGYSYTNYSIYFVEL